MGDKGEVAFQEGFKIAAGRPGEKSHGLAGAGHGVQVGPPAVDPDHFPEPPHGDGDVVVTADHGQTGRPAVPLLGLLHQPEPADEVLTGAGPGPDIHQQLPRAETAQLPEAIHLPVHETNPRVDAAPESGQKIHQVDDRVPGHHQQDGIHDRLGARLLGGRIQTGPFSEDFAAAQGHDVPAIGLVHGQPDFPGPDDEQVPHRFRILLEQLFSGPDFHDVDRFDDGLQFIAVHFGPAIEYLCQKKPQR